MGLVGLFRSVMEAEENQKRKFTCKLCNKKFPCGKSLGGHLRSHRIARATDLVKINNEGSSSSLSVAYVLRENPRKTQRFGDSGGERFCKECGKGFRSMKALCGHMACHSEKVTMMSKFGSDDDFSGFDRKLKRKQVVMDSQSDTEASSCTPRYENSLGFFNNIEHEQDQEVARCLMMLSRDSALICSFPDNNSVFLDSDMKIKNNIDIVEGSDSGSFNYKVKSVHGFDSGLEPFDAESGKRASKQQTKKILGTKKIKGHECPICFRVFRSGQALGGHKRSHFIGGSYGRPQDEVSGLFDLNLPAPEDTKAS